MDFLPTFIHQRTMKNKWLLLWGLWFWTPVFGQDTLRFLEYSSYIRQVLEHHPGVQRTDLLTQAGEAKLRMSKGYTDPKMFGEINQKYFDNKQYYSYANGGIKVPTWYGLSVESGYVLNDGMYMNPDQRVPENGLFYAGVQLNLGNGLIMNERLAQLQKGRIALKSSSVERTIFLNQLLYDATEAYMKWFATYEKWKIYRDGLENAKLRFEGVKSSAQFGDRPSIDTTEAHMNLQDREALLNESWTAFLNAEEQLEIYLWTQGSVPLEIEQVFPVSPIEDTLWNALRLMDVQVIENHPFLRFMNLKMEESQVALKLKKEQLKPSLNLKYNAISEPVGNNPFENYSPADYQWGATFSYPFITRKARGEVQLAKIKLQDQQLALLEKQQELSYKLSVAKNTVQLAEQQIALRVSIAKSAGELYNAERKMFSIGESSVFLVNTRESNYLKAQLEVVDTQLRLFRSINEWLLIAQGYSTD